MIRTFIMLAGAITILGCAGCGSETKFKSIADIEKYRTYYNEALQELSGESYHGRSNYGDGNIKTAKYLIGELQQMGIWPMVDEVGAEPQQVTPPFKCTVTPCGPMRFEGTTEDKMAYLQHYSLPMNVMRGAMQLIVDGNELVPAVDFVAKEFSPSCKGDFELAFPSVDNYTSVRELAYHINSGIYKNKFVVIEWEPYSEKIGTNAFDRYKEFMEMLRADKVAGVIYRLESKSPYFKARSYYVTPVPAFFVWNGLADESKKVSVNMESELIEVHDAHNVLASIKGTKYPEKRYLLMGHFDHLGYMGMDNVHPGANDNASGPSMMLALAKYFSENPPECTIDFAFFDAEENNLLGSFYYKNNPRYPQENIRYILNYDMVADTPESIYLQIPEEGMAGYDLIQKINMSFEEPFNFILDDIVDDSDNYFFALDGVPSIYFHTEGKYKDIYHTPSDTYENISDVGFERLFTLTINFIEKY